MEGDLQAAVEAYGIGVRGLEESWTNAIEALGRARRLAREDGGQEELQRLGELGLELWSRLAWIWHMETSARSL